MSRRIKHCDVQHLFLGEVFLNFQNARRQGLKSQRGRLPGGVLPFRADTEGDRSVLSVLRVLRVGWGRQRSQQMAPAVGGKG